MKDTINRKMNGDKEKERKFKKRLRERKMKAWKSIWMKGGNRAMRMLALFLACILAVYPLEHYILVSYATEGESLLFDSEEDDDNQNNADGQNDDKANDDEKSEEEKSKDQEEEPSGAEPEATGDASDKIETESSSTTETQTTTEEDGDAENKTTTDFETDTEGETITEDETETETVTEEEIQSEPDMQVITVEADGMEIAVEGALPERASLEAISIEGDTLDLIGNAIVALDDTMQMSLAGLMAYDISVVDETGETVSVDDSVTVRLTGAASDYGEESIYQVYYMEEEDGEMKPSDMKTWCEGDDVCFETDHFSIYALAVFEQRENMLMLLDESAPIDIKGQLLWIDREINTDIEPDVTYDIDWSQYTRPESAGEDMLELYYKETGGNEAITLQTSNSSESNYLYWTYEAGGNHWTYNITNVEQRDNLYLKIKSPTGYEDVPEIKIESASVDMQNMEIDFKQLKITKQLVSDEGDNTEFSFDVKVGDADTKYKTVKINGAGSDITTEIPAGVKYSVAEVEKTGYVTVYDGSESGTMGADGSEVIVKNLKNASKIEVTVNWNDNNDEQRMKAVDWLSWLNIYYKIGDDGEQLLAESADPDGSTASSRAITSDAQNEIGLSGTLNLGSPDVTQFNTWKMSCTIDGNSLFPSYTSEGKKISYYIREDGKLSSIPPYAVEYENDGQLIMNTKTTDFIGSLEWSDAAMKDKRPESVTVKLYRYSGTNINAATNIDSITLSADAGNESATWNISIEDLPGFSPEGNIYTYYVQLDAINKEDASYTVSYDNGSGPYGNDTSRMFSGGTINATLTAAASFRFALEWKDDGVEGERSTGSLYLYRYTTDKNIKDAAPVTFLKDDGSSAVIFKELPKANGTITFDDELNAIKSGTKLPKYNEKGVEYIYFVREILSDNKYVKSYNNAENGAFDGGSITNLRQEDMKYIITQEWKTAALQSIPSNLTVYVEIMQKEKNAAGGDWETAAGVYDGKELSAYPLSGFTVAELTKEFELTLPRYSAEGKELIYTAVAKEVKEGANTYSVQLDNSDYIFTTKDGHSYKCTDDGATGGGSLIDRVWTDGICLTNTLFGKMKYKLIKRWNPTPSDVATTAYVELTLTAIDHSGNDIEIGKYKLTNDDSDGELNSTAKDGETYWSNTTDEIDKYDAEGYEYSYTVEETTCSATHPTGASYANYVIYGENEATVHNLTGGETLQIHVKKIWKDDGDTSSRLPVTVGLFDQAGQPVQQDSKNMELVLSEKNNWESYFTLYKASGSSEFPDLTGYTVRELEIGNYPVNYNDSNPVSYTEGTAVTNYHRYKVKNECTYEAGKLQSCNITNTRVGKVTVTVIKQWHDGATTPNNSRPSIALTLSDESKSEIASVKLTAAEEGFTVASGDFTAGEATDNTWKGNFAVLDKYDSNGKVIHYSVEEAIAEGTDYVREVVAKDYTSGTGNDIDKDIQTITIANTREGSTDFIVHKKWMDAGSASARPDIYVELWYTIGGSELIRYADTKAESHKDHSTVYVGELDYLWGTDVDSGQKYDSFCKVSGLNQYTEDGTEILYYAKETILVPGEYEKLYYEAYDNGSGSGSYTTLREDCAPNDGYIINRLSGEITVQGLKQWTNLQPGNALNSDLTKTFGNIDISLYRYVKGADYDSGKEFMGRKRLGADTGGSYTEFAFKKGDEVRNKDNDETKELAALSKYNEKGELYIYAIEEKINDKMQRVYEGGVDIFTLTNTFNQGEGNNRTISVEKKWAGIEEAALGKIAEQTGSLLYPELTFNLYRQLPDDEGKYSDDKKDFTLYKTITCTPSGSGSAAYVNNIKFEGLLVWAENGRQYRYAVAEVAVAGYTTTSVASVGDVEKDTGDGWCLIPEEQYAEIGNVPTATKVSFTNTFCDTVDNRITLSGTKIWKDASDSSLRPADLTLTVSRRAGSNDGWKELSTDYYTIEWTKDADTWTYKITPVSNDKAGIVRYAPNGKAYQYRITETVPTHYKTNAESVVSTTFDNNERILTIPALTNTLSAEFTVSKVWDDSGDLYAVRPVSVQIKLQRKKDSEDWADVTGTEEDGFGAEGIIELDHTVKWTKTIKNLAPTYSYRAVEHAVVIRDNSIGNLATIEIDNTTDATNGRGAKAGTYTISYSDSGSGNTQSTKIINTLSTTSLKVVKKWVDNSNKYNSRPVSSKNIPEITVKLQYKTGTNEYTDMLDAQKKSIEHTLSGTADELEYTFSNLPKCDSAGNNYSYRAVEDTSKVQNYEITRADSGSSEAGFLSTITNTLNITEDTLSTITARKEWKDDLTDRSGLSTVFELERYVSDASGKLQKIEYTSAQTIMLNGVADGDDASLAREVSPWMAQWKNLPDKYFDGRAITYRVIEREAAVPAGYLVSTVEGTGDEPGFIITNTQKASLTVTKKWTDSENKYASRPEKAYVMLQRSLDNGANWEDVRAEDLCFDGIDTDDIEVVKELAVPDGSSDMSVTFDNLPLFDLPAGNANQKRYQYRAVEVVKDGNSYVKADSDTFKAYRQVIGDLAYDDTDKKYYKKYSHTITNKLVTGSITVELEWDDDDNRDGLRPESVTMELLHDTQSYGNGETGKIELTFNSSSDKNNEGNAIVTITDLPIYDLSTGKAISYSVAEMRPDGSNLTTAYEVTYQAPANVIAVATGDIPVITVINKHTPETVSMAVRKIWVESDASGALREEIRPDTIKVNLMMNGTSGSAVDKYVGEDGEPSDASTDFSGRSLPIAGAAEESAKWTAAWNDMYVNRNPTKAVGDNVSYKITYGVKEDSVTGYTTEYGDGSAYGTDFLIKNTLEETEFTVKKIWDDNQNAYNTRPDSIVLTLQYRVGATAWKDLSESSPTNEQMMSDSFEITYSGLPKRNKAGEEYEYRVQESNVPGYRNTYSYAKSESADMTITNTLETVSISGSKTWEGDKYGNSVSEVRPTGQIDLKVQVSDDNGAHYTDIDPKTVVSWQHTDTDKWSYSISGLPKYVKGSSTPRKYRVTEEELLHYECTSPADGFAYGTEDAAGNIINANFTNKLKTMTIRGTKRWDDKQNVYQLRPENTASTDFAVSLYRKTDLTSYVKVENDSSVKWTWDCNDVTGYWYFTISGLTEYDDAGNKYTYKIMEETVPTGYKPSYATTILTGVATDNGENGGIIIHDIPDDQESIVGCITNTLLSECTLKVSKIRNPAPAADSQEKFTFEIILEDITDVETWRQSEEALKNTYPRYVGSYSIGSTSGGNKVTRDITPKLTNLETTNGYITIGHGEYFTVKLPAGGKYTVSELQDATSPTGKESGYQTTKSDNYRGTMAASSSTTGTEVSFTNQVKPVLAIENTTPNYAHEGESTDELQLPTDAGGKVAVTLGSEITNDSGVSYQPEALEASWQNAPYWNHSDGFSVFYTDYGSEEVKEIKVEGYLTPEGQLITDKNNIAYEKLIQKFPQFTISQGDNGKIILQLTDNVSQMPATVAMRVKFDPTIAVLNTTARNEGGMVGIKTMSEVSDGEINRYTNQTVIRAQAKAGFWIAADRIAIDVPGEVKDDATARNMVLLAANGDAGMTGALPRSQGIYLTPDAQGNFTTEVNLPVNDGKVQKVRIEGSIQYQKDTAGNPVEAEIRLKDLKAPLDIGISFVKVSSNSDSGNSDSDDSSSNSKHDSSSSGSGKNGTSGSVNHGNTSVTGQPPQNDIGTVSNGTGSDINAENALRGDLIPKTGDEFHLLFWMMLTGISLIGCLVTVIFQIRRKRRGLLFRKVMIGILAICVAAGMLGGLTLGNYLWIGHRAQAQFEAISSIANVQAAEEHADASEPVEENLLTRTRNLNCDTWGWVSIEETKINYPVMYTPDAPGYYLHRNMERQDDVAGVPYIDERCDIDGNHLIVYGHNMKNGLMFAGLTKYKDKEFYTQHKEILLTCDDSTGGERTYEVIAAFALDADTESEDILYFDGSEQGFADYLENIQQRSIYTDAAQAEFGDRLLTLCTCDYSTPNGRFVVIAVEK